ncbi:MAG: N,N'-diacetylchitobiose phosphorylase [Saccharofermentanales bacterium]
MKYGHFSQERKEYVITRPDTPAPWANYLGSPDYGAIISQNAGGYSFVKSGAKGRILRYRFNYDDKPGRYIYLRDDESGDYWSASWQPVGKGEGYSSQCRHGLGYTIISSEYSGISTETSYYVPLNKTYEVWRLRLRNNSKAERRLSVFGYAEFTNNGDYEQDLVNLQYSQFISKTYFDDNKILQRISENSDEAVERFFALTGAPVSSYTGDKADFIGAYRSYANPQAVASGKCSNTLNYCLNSCGGLHTALLLQPGEERELVFILGQHDKERADEIIRPYQEKTQDAPTHRCVTDLEELATYWEKKLENFRVKTPDDNFNQMVNTWNAYQCFITFTWSRAASLIYCGQRNGYGYRDTVQDIQGIIHLAPELAREKLIFMLSAQVDNGGGLPLVKFDHKPGQEDTPDDFSYVQETGHPSYRADDALWLFPTIRKYIAETGDNDLLDLTVPYANSGTASVYEHLKKAIDFSFNNLGRNGLPAGLYADWNDTLRLGEKGESTFVALQLYLALTIMESFAALREDTAYAKEVELKKSELSTKIETLYYEGDRYIRGITEDGLRIGSKDSIEASFWLNPQSWAVLSAHATGTRATEILDLVYEELFTDYGARLMNSSFKQLDFEGALAKIYNPSCKENAGIFLQPQGWLVLAESLLERGDRAYEIYQASSPAEQNDIADIRQLEPYVYGQFTESTESPHEGRSHIHWLTGTASTMMVACVEGILGIRPDLNGILIQPSIPQDWDQLEIEKLFRGKKLLINIQNKNKKESGYTEIYLNGQRRESNHFPYDELSDYNEIVYIM